LATLWLREPNPGRLTRLEACARSARDRVPEPRRGDWDKLVSRLAVDDARRNDRLLALRRACALFAAEAPALDPEGAVATVPGLGTAAREALAEHGITTVFDLLWTLPTGYDDLAHPLDVEQALEEARASLHAGLPSARICVRGVVHRANLVFAGGRRFVSVVLRGEQKGTLTLSWFFVAHGILAVAKPGQRCLVVGRIRLDSGGRARMAHPDLLRDNDGTGVRARYPRLGVPEAAFRRSVAIALERMGEPNDPVPQAIAVREGMTPAIDLLRAIHATGALGVPSEDTRRAALERLAFGEAFTRSLQRIAAEKKGGDAPALPLHRAVLARLRAELGFELTRGQRDAIATIAHDLAKPTPMRRLLLGDVGTGKTAVALAAAAQCVSAGYQVAILAPTGVLAEQYMDAVGPLARATGAAVALVVASTSTGARGGQWGGQKTRKGLLAPIADGTIAVAVGTHALLGEGVRFARLGLVIVDEQHRVGVAQRVALVRKGGRPHLLTLSATPIPRTLALALRGELATSTLEERPRGRVPVETVVLPQDAEPQVLEELRQAVGRGERAFFICPRIEASDDDDEEPARVPSAVQKATELSSSLAPIHVALLHGGQKVEAQRSAMRAFRRGDAQILVATTVVEVGVDVPEATRIVVLGAERFGLAQLHQLRGRVGRGDRPGRCILLHGPLDSLAARRLEAIRTLRTGEEVAHADLSLRGAGDLGGTRQSGAEEELLYLDPGQPPSWLERLEADARLVHERDPDLQAPEHRGLALAMRRFAKALAVRDEAG
jgi:ATP-dependent DNA helicase RecG